METEALFPCIMPAIAEDYERTKIHYNKLFKYLPICELLLIGPESLKSHIENDVSSHVFGDNTVCFIDESSILPIAAIKDIYDNMRSNASQTKISSVNWYYQQFLKMAFSFYCEDDYYICWDSDTIPLKIIAMFNSDNKPYLDIKSEHNTSYFLTIQKLFGFRKIIEKSFISEHMIFNTKLMREMIEEIETLPISGQKYYEKILSAVGCDNLALGFSEFETYGTWIGMRNPSAYVLRNWNSIRNTNFFIDIADITEDDIDWLSKDYDAATFEKYHETDNSLTELFRNPYYREKLSPKQFYTSVLESGIMGDYTNGMIEFNGFMMPT
ncbi:DUF6492 family protein [Butyrivibrio sp. YAB3001]|uniref:DUF6492 family protein n=1 Tax=Butyrivibrio sp. YAB3001 TaxID=1520812 RepID=UPI0008F662D3|nr:DUF6492 family protein [Butyrivibrio sp. YAB3001]SFB94904.1 hypothetical protein SAMN02910398_01110 [Butyrivibrio sp. YAB3001]